MWNNIATKKNPKAPDFKCRDKACDGVVWPPKGVQSVVSPARTAPAKQGYSSGPAIAGLDDGSDDLPTEKLDHLFRVYSIIEDHILATSVQKFTKADIGTTPESVAAQIATLLIAAQKAGV
jgi:hypothetical protein